MKKEIRYVERKDIDLDKWNGCVQNALNGLCYSDSSFLDAMSAEWSALVLNDYEAVMPLTYRKKFGVSYLYQPAFCQQTGITMLTADESITDDFLAHIPSRFKYWDIQLNALNSTAFPHTMRKNYLLPLTSDETAPGEKYHRNAIRNIRRAKEEQIVIREDIPASSLLQLHLARFRNQNNVSAGEYRAFENLLDRWARVSRAKIVGAEDRNGHLIASSGYLIYKDRITFVINGNHLESLSNGATYLLKDHIIRKYSGTGYLLDFEGSDNPDFARFYEQFGANTVELYPRIICNKLPWPFNWLKR